MSCDHRGRGVVVELLPAGTTAAGNQLFQLHKDGSIWRWTGVGCSGGCSGWQQLDNDAATVMIAAGSAQLAQLHKDGSIWRYDGSACAAGACPGWQQLDNNPAAKTIVVGGAD